MDREYIMYNFLVLVLVMLTNEKLALLGMFALASFFAEGGTRRSP